MRGTRRAGVAEVFKTSHHADPANVDVDLRRHQDGLAAEDRVGTDLDVGGGEVRVAQVDDAAAEQRQGGQSLRDIPAAAPLEAAHDREQHGRRCGPGRTGRTKRVADTRQI
jgi:hypothetical protein